MIRRTLLFAVALLMGVAVFHSAAAVAQDVDTPRAESNVDVTVGTIQDNPVEEAPPADSLVTETNMDAIEESSSAPDLQQMDSLGNDPSAETAISATPIETPMQAQIEPLISETPEPNIPQGEADGTKKKISWQDIPSVLFTFWESSAVQEARNSRGLARPPSEAELARDLNLPPSAITEPKEKVKPPPEAREIKLGGIAYKSEKIWTIWLNGQRVTPNALPKEILDIHVNKSYIEIKWFDEYTNRILPIRLRPHQRFNMDTRIFLPG